MHAVVPTFAIEWRFTHSIRVRQPCQKLKGELERVRLFYSGKEAASIELHPMSHHLYLQQHYC